MGFPLLGNAGILGSVAKCCAILRLITANQTENTILFRIHSINVFLNYKFKNINCYGNIMQTKSLGMLSIPFSSKICTFDITL